MNLYKHQKDAIEWLKDRPKAILALDMGLGKTLIAIKTFKDNERILIICPATLKLNWKKEIYKWSDRKDINIILKKKDIIPKKGIVIINYDILGGRVKKKITPNFNFSGFDRVIIDESHYIKTPKSIRSKIAAKIVKTTPNAVLLSGTLGERSKDLFVPLFSIGATDLTWTKYADKFCDPKRIFIGRKEIWDYNGLSNPAELKKLMTPYTLIMKKEDVIDLPDKIIKVICLDLHVDKREKNYNLNDIIKDKRPIGFEGLSELLHDQGLLKVAQAVAHIKMHLETSRKVFVIAKHHDVIDLLMEKLKDYNPVKLDGRDSAYKRDRAVYKFQNSKNCKVFVGQIKAAGTGITLTAASLAVIVENNWSYSDLTQAIDRLHRIGAKSTVVAEILTISGSIDDRVLHKTLEKKQFNMEVLS